LIFKGSRRNTWSCGFILTVFVLLCNSVLAQDVNEYFFDEVNVSFNRTNLNNSNTENRNGFGVGLYHSFFSNDRANLTFGLEYNRTNQFKKYLYESRYTHTTDMTYNMHVVSIPVGLRINAGRKIKVFLETGFYADLMIKSRRSGMMHTNYPRDTGVVVNEVYHVNEKVKLPNSVGLYAGLGIRIPVSRFELILRPDYKYGLNKLYSYRDDIYNRYWRITLGFKLN
jgi:hypothetical protein